MPITIANTRDEPGTAGIVGGTGGELVVEAIGSKVDEATLGKVGEAVGSEELSSPGRSLSQSREEGLQQRLLL